MFDHMERKNALAEPMQRRDQSRGEAQATCSIGDGVPQSYAAIARARPKPDRTRQIDSEGGDERSDNPGIECPGQVRLFVTGAVSQGCASAGKDQDGKGR